VIEREIRERVLFQYNQFGFMPGKSTTEAIFILKHVQEKVLEGNNKRNWTFVDLEKAFDRVTSELEPAEDGNKCHQIHISRVKTRVRNGVGSTESFEIKVCVRQRSCSSPLLFIIVMDAVSEAVRREVPCEMLYTLL